MIKLRFFERSDFQRLINWIETLEFLLQWGGPNLVLKGALIQEGLTLFYVELVILTKQVSVIRG
ncbi:hypothetical protein SAMN04487943_107185 [Gracilibacillus orientalis]|uniref:Uncharacterized protein n=1 Tax=Gracilibacillus orientalis TaxID=334253 RepID=A0A1I4MY17_9BACI|nr:hypothetical protein SAMN04487943_107185 [Gracilibacillus orientalis]